MLVVLFAASSAFVKSKKTVTSDLVWFTVNSLGVATNPMAGISADEDPYECPDEGNVNCARALSISEGEVELNTGSTTLYHINSGYSTQGDFDADTKKVE